VPSSAGRRISCLEAEWRRLAGYFETAVDSAGWKRSLWTASRRIFFRVCNTKPVTRHPSSARKKQVQLRPVKPCLLYSAAPRTFQKKARSGLVPSAGASAKRPTLTVATISVFFEFSSARVHRGGEASRAEIFDLILAVISVLGPTTNLVPPPSPSHKYSPGAGLPREKAFSGPF